MWVPWEPHLNVAQADAVFRQLRGRGWTTSVSWYIQMRHGMVSVRNRAQHFEQLYGRAGDESEAMALLWCAVLAVSAAQEGHEPCS